MSGGEVAKGRGFHVTDYRSSTEAVIETATNSVIDQITVGPNPFGVAVAPEGKQVS
jgi:YVTN family beta-propeller protein